MTKRNLLSVAALLLMLGLSQMPTVAKPYTQKPSPSLSQRRQVLTDMAIMVEFSDLVEMKSKPEASYSVTLILDKSIVNRFGQTIFSANSPVKARLLPTQDGIVIIADQQPSLQKPKVLIEK